MLIKVFMQIEIRCQQSKLLTTSTSDFIILKRDFTLTSSEIVNFLIKNAPKKTIVTKYSIDSPISSFF